MAKFGNYFLSSLCRYYNNSVLLCQLLPHCSLKSPGKLFLKYEFTPLLKFEDALGERQIFLYPQASSGWSNFQREVRQISKRKQPNLIHMYIWELCIDEMVRDSTCTRCSEIERGIAIFKTP